MSDTDVNIIKLLENLQSDISALRDGQKTLEAGQHALEAGQKSLETGQKTIETGQQALELKVEAIHAYQKQAHQEIMDSLFESNEITGKALQEHETRFDRIEKHVGLPPVK
jgi:peptidoglycan hydrolase CwlO-like protein